MDSQYFGFLDPSQKYPKAKNQPKKSFSLKSLIWTIEKKDYQKLSCLWMAQELLQNISEYKI